MGPGPGVGDAHDRVAIVGLEGVARTKADFTPRQVPNVGNAAPLLQPEARVAGGRVFYADGAGVVRELTRTGVKPLATFALKAQQEISFAVRPDGASIEASRYTFPPVNPNSTDLSNMFLSNTYRYELLAADAGAGSRTLVSNSGGNEVTQQADVIGWDASGPIATTDTAMGSQQGTQGRVIWGHAVHLDASGHAGPTFGGSDCSVVSIFGDTLLCVDDRSVGYSVRTRAGTILWSVPQLPQGQYYAYMVLSRDGGRVAYTGGVRGRDGSSVTLPAKFNPEGWLDSKTLIGITGENNQQEMALIHLSNPSQIDDLGFKGEFIGGCDIVREMFQAGELQELLSAKGVAHNAQTLTA